MYCFVKMTGKSSYMKQLGNIKDYDDFKTSFVFEAVLSLEKS